MEAKHQPPAKGRKPNVKSWATRLRHEVRTDYESDSDTHILMFIAGDRASEVISAALRDFANTHNIPIECPEFQQAVFMQASSLQAANKHAPYPSDVLAALGRNDVLDTLNHALGTQGQELLAPKKAAVPAPAAPQAKTYVTSLASAVQTKPAPSLPSVPAPVSMAPLSSTPVASPPAQRKPLPDIDMGPEIDLAPHPAEPKSEGDAMKKRWLAGHDY